MQFPLAKLAAREAWFGGLTFKRINDTTLHIFLALRDRDGVVREERFEMRRR